jgi:hypothetical protein
MPRVNLLLFAILSSNIAVASISVADEDVLSRGFNDLQPVLKKFCLGCHSTQQKEGELDLQRFTSLASIRKDVKPWQAMILQL